MLLKISITERDPVSAEALTNLIGALRTIADGAQGTLQNCAETMEAGALESDAVTVEPEAKDKPKTRTRTAAKTVKKPEPAPEPEPKEDAEVDYKALREEVRQEAAAIARKGKTKGLKMLLDERGVQKLSDLPDEELASFLAEAKTL
ncbi:hypothetical protein [Selenomonas sputigena]|uniref:hypothetical protein n=1 Tax=Selenomonas sputigena TaxID=69823 RepID=UPI00223013CA|nr:hypothetical protein [Selenomonas sputigena]UZD42775.1 hypothetical protein OL240_09530 [Selenomonas sputigena]